MPRPKRIAKATWRDVKDVRKELEQHIATLGPDELRVILRVTRRLAVGFGRYGEMRLLKDKRDYAKEASEELLDWLVYTEMEAERKLQRRAKQPTRSKRPLNKASTLSWSSGA